MAKDHAGVVTEGQVGGCSRGMLILDSNDVPVSARDLLDLVDRSIRRWIKVPSSTTLVAAIGNLPRLTSATVDLSGGIADTSGGIPPYTLTPSTKPGPSIAAVKVIANPLRVDGISLDFNLTAENVVFGYARSDSGRLVATLETADDGELSIRFSKPNLEAAILRAAQTCAASSGVAILNVDSTLKLISPHVMDVNLKITAKKFVTTVVRVSGRLSLDDQLNATANDLKAEGDGMVGSIAVSFLRPHLEKLQGQPISLMQFSLGKVRLHDVAVSTDNGLQITAAFGATTSDEESRVNR